MFAPSWPDEYKVVMTKVLGIFAKAPWPGQVKTRLAAETTPVWAAHVADIMLHETVQRTAAMDAKRILVFAPDSAHSFFEQEFPGLQLEPQGDGDLGQRMQRFLEQQLHGEARQVVVLGTDSPTVPLSYFHQAFAMLDSADVVVGPATDGGYYLIGCSSHVPAIFEGIAWGGSSVFEDTITRLPATCRLALLPPWYDVDTLADWHFMRAHVKAMSQAAMRLSEQKCDASNFLPECGNSTSAPEPL
jgi:uncharacterized protein